MTTGGVAEEGGIEQRSIEILEGGSGAGPGNRPSLTAEPPDAGTALREFIVQVHALLEGVANVLVMARGLNEGYRDALSLLIREDSIGTRAQEILDALDFPSDEVLLELRNHGLNEGSVELQFKLAAFKAALERSNYVVTRMRQPSATPQLRDVRVEPQPPPRSEGRLHAVLSGLAAAFGVANSILKSLTKAIPAAGAYGEIKDSIEDGIDSLANGGSLIGRLLNKVRPKQKKQPRDGGLRAQVPAPPASS